MPPAVLIQGRALKGAQDPILWDPSSTAPDHETFPRRLSTPPHLCSLYPASLCLRINAAVTAAEKSLERRLTPGAAQAGLAMGGCGVGGLMHSPCEINRPAAGFITRGPMP